LYCSPLFCCRLTRVQAGAKGAVEKATLKALFRSAMTADKETVARELKRLIDRLPRHAERKAEDAVQSVFRFVIANFAALHISRSIDALELAVRLEAQYPKDVGVFAVFLLNCFKCALFSCPVHCYCSLISSLLYQCNRVRRFSCPPTNRTRTFPEIASNVNPCSSCSSCSCVVLHLLHRYGVLRQRCTRRVCSACVVGNSYDSRSSCCR
jgi:hypothetical protein